MPEQSREALEDLARNRKLGGDPHGVPGGQGRSVPEELLHRPGEALRVRTDLHPDLLADEQAATPRVRIEADAGVRVDLRLREPPTDALDRDAQCDVVLAWLAGVRSLHNRWRPKGIE
eukprot:6870962-Lingulodinium_polyedra.AAC.1